MLLIQPRNSSHGLTIFGDDAQLAIIRDAIDAHLVGLIPALRVAA